MIDLSQSVAASPLIHTVAADPGRRWLKDADIAVDAAPDSAASAQPVASNGDVAVQAVDWRASSEERTGIFGAVSPRVIALPDGGYRLFYTQIFPRSGYPMGAVDYDQASSRILSASSVDGLTWSPEPGVRLSPQAGGAGDYRVVSSDVVPVGSGELWRMYYECCPGTQATTNSIRSAISHDLGNTWSVESGVRWQTDGHNYSAPRILHLDDGRCRLYCVQRGLGIISVVSSDGLNFQREPGVRLLPDSAHDRLIAFAPEIVRVAGAGYIMYYAGYGQPDRAYILRAVSTDGLTWHKEPEPVLEPSAGGWDAAKCSEMSLLPLYHTDRICQFRMLYEACDGTAWHQRGVWRIASAKKGSGLFFHQPSD